MDRLFTMRVFLQVADCGSFASAARTLGLSRPMVTRAVAQLEAHLNARLLQRSSRKVTPTAIGYEFAQRCHEILAATAEAEACAGNAGATPSGELRIAMPCALAIALASPLVAAYCKRYPDVSIELTLVDRPIDLVEEGFDVAVVNENMLLSDDVTTHDANRCQFIACCTPSWLQGRELLSFDDVREHRILCIKGFARHLSAAGCTRLHVSSSVAALKLLVREGIGIAILPAYAVADELAAGQLAQVLHQAKLPSIDVQVAYPTRKHVSPKVLRFVDMSLEQIQAFDDVAISEALA
ncbi:LysR family transcriptional regulator [Paraburkholderia humisilvae]|uniref:HTH-type transcriptional regulator DmlR n=1 Tax=Paraburkholderia humisilvae TaxID=627669 RepID=A0A6J5DDL4_9BURK|nr:LysR family transcriptional regulator [Paraburkholderia humisilvae]CAB3750906.1 HTH-type transcriptional regulator DmlR [Paraburkholderia humisilvae]